MNLLNSVNKLIWGMPALFMILGVGLFLSFRTGFAQFRLFPKALRSFWRQFARPADRSADSPYRALCTALAATVGTGNLIGVAGAIVLGGPGSVFWMWICALVGMVIKFAEATLAVRYRVKDSTGTYMGGPMYMIRHGLHKRWSFLAVIYATLGLVASLGVGNLTQVNAVILGAHSVMEHFGVQVSGIFDLLIGLLLAAIVGAVLVGGAKRIGDVAQKLVPIAAVGYLFMCAVVLIGRSSQIPNALLSIVRGAFSPQAVTGGVLGSAFQAVRVGASRGTFTNEAGMGTAAIAHANANVSHPVDQGLMGIMEVFLDTIVICTMTALVILCSGIHIPYGVADSGLLTQEAFTSVLGSWTSVPVALAVCAFAVATIFGWSLYGARCAQFLFGDRAWRGFAFLQAGTVVLGAVVSTEAAWLVAEIFNGLMALPNLVALGGLSPELVRLLKEYRTGA